MIRRYLLAGAALAAFAAPPLVGATEAADTYKLDPVHSNIVFATDHMGFAKMIGQFQEFDGTFTFDGNSAEGVTVEVVVKTASIDTDHEARDKHLTSPDFFNAQEFPEMTFKSTSVEPTGDNTAKLTGELTLLGVTKPITLDVTFNKADANPMDPNVFIAGFSAKGTLKRSDFGMQYGQGAIGDEVMLWIEAEGHRQ